jgi:hypothetical protein
VAALGTNITGERKEKQKKREEKTDLIMTDDMSLQCACKPH